MRRPSLQQTWSGRIDAADGAAARRWHQLVRVGDRSMAPLGLLGFACDAGVQRNQGRPGAAAGPAALRQALCNLSAHAVESIDDLGDIVCVGDALEAAQQAYAAVVAEVIEAGHLPLGLGGGHEIAFASYQGLEAATQGSIAIVNFDAHLDLRGDARGSSGTPFRQALEQAAAQGRDTRYLCMGASRFANTAALFQRARSLGASWIEDTEVRADRFDALRETLLAHLEEVDHAYLTICLDAFPAAYAPGVSAPAALGIDPLLAERLIEVVVDSGKLRIADVAELNPAQDIDLRTARLAARLIARIAEGAAQRAS